MTATSNTPAPADRPDANANALDTGTAPADGANGAEAAPRRRKRGRSFVRDGIGILGSNFSHMGISVLTGIAVARIWGPEMRGMLAAATNIPGILVNAGDVGMKKVIPRVIGQNTMPIEKAVGIGLSLWLVTSIIAMLIALADFFLFSPGAFSPLWAVLAVLVIPGQMFTNYARGIALGVQEIGFFNKLYWTRDPIILIVILVGGLVLGLDPWVYFVAFIAAYGMFVFDALRVIRRHSPVRFYWDTKLALGMLKEGAVFSAGSILMKLNYVVNISVIKHYIVVMRQDPTAHPNLVSAEALAIALGNFTVGVGLARALWQIPISLNYLVFSRSVNTDDPLAFARKTCRLVRVGTLLAIPLAAVLWIIAPWMFPLVYGKGYEQAAVITQLMLPGIVAFFPARMFEADLTAKGKPWAVTIVMLPVVLANIFLNLWLIPKDWGFWGIELGGVKGVAVIGSITYAMGTLGLTIVYWRVTGLPLLEILMPRPSDFRLRKKGEGRGKGRKKDETAEAADSGPSMD